MRTARRTVALAIVSSGLVASCSLLVQFHDQALPCEASACDEADVGTDSGQSLQNDAPSTQDVTTLDSTNADTTTPPMEAEPPETGPPPNACPPGLDTNQELCATEQGVTYNGPASDLLECAADTGVFLGVAASCDAGCILIPGALPDTCNGCPFVTDPGYYCGRDLPSFNQVDRDILVHCVSGGVADLDACVSGCHSNAANLAASGCN